MKDARRVPWVMPAPDAADLKEMVSRALEILRHNNSKARTGMFATMSRYDPSVLPSPRNPEKRKKIETDDMNNILVGRDLGFDFDLGVKCLATVNEAVKIASPVILRVCEELDKCGLAHLVKFSGSGIHVHVPLAPLADWTIEKIRSTPKGLGLYIHAAGRCIVENALSEGFRLTWGGETERIDPCACEVVEKGHSGNHVCIIEVQKDVPRNLTVPYSPYRKVKKLAGTPLRGKTVLCIPFASVRELEGFDVDDAVLEYLIEEPKSIAWPTPSSPPPALLIQTVSTLDCCPKTTRVSVQQRPLSSTRMAADWLARHLQRRARRRGLPPLVSLTKEASRPSFITPQSLDDYNVLPCLRNMILALQHPEHTPEYLRGASGEFNHDARMAVTSIFLEHFTSQEIIAFFSRLPDYDEGITRRQISSIRDRKPDYGPWGCQAFQNNGLCPCAEKGCGRSIYSTFGFHFS